METGRPSTYSQEIADKICEQIATSSKGLNAICQQGEFPNPSTVYRWINEHEDFCKKYARAREMQAEYMMEQSIDIADDDSRDLVQGAEGAFPNGVNVQRARLQIDTRKWAASKLYPKKFGEKIQTELSGSINTNSDLDLSKYTDEELEQLIKLQSKGRAGQA